MKLEIITSPPETVRYDKKDFTDLSCLLDDFSISEMIEIFKKAHPAFEFPERIILEGFQCAELADNKPNPNMLIELKWEQVKDKINLAIKNHLNKNF